jgi:outer membrane protein TolC
LDRKFRQNQWWPELNLIGTYGRSAVDSFFPGFTNFTVPPVITPRHQASFGDAVDDLKHNVNQRWSVGFVLRMPINNKTERNRLKAAKELEKQTEAQVRLLQQQVIVEVQDAMEVAIAARERISARWQAAQAAEVALKAERDRLFVGTSTFVQVSVVQKDYITALSQYIGALAVYNKALVLLYYSDGTLLDRKKISVQLK